MGMLEIAERLANKQHGDTRFTQVQAPGGKTLLLLVCSDYGGTEGYRGAQMQSGVEVCMQKYEVRASSTCPPGLYIEAGRSQAQIESVTSLGFTPLNFLSTLVLFSKDLRASWALATR